MYVYIHIYIHIYIIGLILDSSGQRPVHQGDRRPLPGARGAHIYT